MLEWIKGKTAKNRRDFGKYNFHVKHQPEYIDSSTTLTLTTYTNTSQTATLPCRYRWSVIKNGLTIQVPQFKGSSFRCQPSDVGSIVQAQVISTDGDFGGTAIIQFGPVKIDVGLKKQIEVSLSSGCMTMPVYVVNSNNSSSSSGSEEKECQIRLFQDVIKINHAYSEANYTFDFSIFEPRVECLSKDPTKIVIVFGEKYENELRRFSRRLFQGAQGGMTSSKVTAAKDLTSSLMSKPTSSAHGNGTYPQNKLQIRFSSRNNRDVFLFTMKAFNTKKQLRSSAILNKIQKIDFTNGDTFDYVLQIESLRSEMVKMDMVVKKAYQEKIKYMEEINRLEKEIEEIIMTYTRIVEEKFQSQAELNKDVSVLSTKRDDLMAKKYRNLEQENNQLNQRIQSLSKQIDNIRFKPQTPIYQNTSLTPFQKVHFNYQANLSKPFAKKRHLEDPSCIGQLLDQMGDSRISYISSIKQVDPELKDKLDHAEWEKEQLQKKLQKSFHKIDELEKQLYQKDLNNQKKLSSSAVYFTYQGQNGLNASFDSKGQNMSAIFQLEKEKLQTQNSQLKKSNESLKLEKNKLIQQLKNSQRFHKELKNRKELNDNKNTSPKARHLQRHNSGKGENFNNSLNFLKTQKKESSQPNNKESSEPINKESEKTFEQLLEKKQLQIKLLNLQNQALKKNIEKLKQVHNQLISENDELKIKVSNNSFQKQKCTKLQKKIQQLEEEIQMYRKNADALNRSQQLSLQMDTYNEEQIQMLKQHNEFLTNENQKLSKACEKYMVEAKEANKLRMEIIRLKGQIHELQQKLNDSSLLGPHQTIEEKEDSHKTCQ